MSHPEVSFWAMALTSLAMALSVIPVAGQTDGARERERAIVARSLVSQGDTARVQRVLAKGRRGEPVTIGVIGGSITQGASASSPENTYGSRIAQWWRRMFPNSEVTFVNAGIGATGSNYGALRAQRDLLSKSPDLVVVEYAVNDPNTEQAAETYEGLLRQILKQPQQPAIVLIFTMAQGGGNAQEWQSKVGAHYGLPMVSFRDALWPEIEAGSMQWEDVEADTVHPNDRGHAYMALFITTLLGRVLAEMGPDEELPAPGPVPEPLLSDLFERVALYEARDLVPLRNEGWTLDDSNVWTAAWVANQPGSTIEFELEGQVIVFMEYHVRGPMGIAAVQVDELPPVTVDAWFDQTWGGFRLTRELARGLTPGKHRVRVEVLAERNAQSEGHEFRIMGIGAAGLL
ncbi:MAG: SGNH/GDSL hydrolase family protein [Armatimonadetes bacterium]|nr:SGNH/GDSL hydrolase family protein [Armatimonadota bacterium]